MLEVPLKRPVSHVSTDAVDRGWTHTAVVATCGWPLDRPKKSEHQKSHQIEGEFGMKQVWGSNHY